MKLNAYTVPKQHNGLYPRCKRRGINRYRLCVLSLSLYRRFAGVDLFNHSLVLFLADCAVFKQVFVQVLQIQVLGKAFFALLGIDLFFQ